MRILLLLLTIAGLTALSQTVQTGEQKHLLVPSPPGTVGAVTVSATSIERSSPSPSVIRLRGNVEIKAYNVLVKADEAEYHEDTTEVEARGNVRIKLSEKP